MEAPDEICALLCAFLGLSTCTAPVANDPIYAALKASPPKAIPAKHLPKLRNGRASCDVFNEGKASQYMTCWWPIGRSVPPVAILTYYGGGLQRPDPANIIASGGRPVTDYLKIR